MSIVDTILREAAAQEGKPYVYGDDGPNAFDCSGLITYIYGLVGIKLPHNAAEQQRSSKVTRVTDPLPGDLVFYGNPATHVALYVGNGKMIAAPHSGATVQLQDVYGKPTYGRVAGLGLASNPVVGSVSQSAVNAADITAGLSFNLDSFFGQVEGTVLNVAVASLGLALVGAGLWLTVSSKGKQLLANVGVPGLGGS
jgi:hypothetical protein